MGNHFHVDSGIGKSFPRWLSAWEVISTLTQCIGSHFHVDSVHGKSFPRWLSVRESFPHWLKVRKSFPHMAICTGAGAFCELMWTCHWFLYYFNNYCSTMEKTKTAVSNLLEYYQIVHGGGGGQRVSKIKDPQTAPRRSHWAMSIYWKKQVKNGWSPSKRT